MKTALVLLSFVANTAFAFTKIEWAKDSEIPVDVRTRIEQTANARCQPIGIGWKEASTSIREELTDDGIVDYFYTVILSSKFKIDQVMMEDVDSVQIEVAKFSFSNPKAGDPIEVRYIKGLRNNCK